MMSRNQNQAVELLKKSGLKSECCVELFEQFCEDETEYSEETAMEKLQTAIKDSQYGADEA